MKFKYYTPLILQKVAYVIFFVFYKIFVKLEITGRENLRGLSGPIILAANHTSELDATVIPLILPFFSRFSPIYFVANPTEKYKTFGWRSYFYGGVFFSMIGAYPVFSGRENYAISLQSHESLLRRGRTVCIFPEGKRTRDGKMNPARGGLGYLVLATGARVVPIAINTFFNFSWTDFFLRRRTVRVSILKMMSAEEIISTTKPTAEDCRAGSEKVLAQISSALEA